MISNNFECWTNIDSSNHYNKSYKIGEKVAHITELLVMCLSRSMSSVYMSIPVSQFNPLLSPLVSMYLFSMSVSLFLLCK